MLAVLGCVAIVAIATIFAIAVLGIAPSATGAGSIYQGLWGSLATAVATIVGAFAIYIGGTRALQSAREQIAAEDRRRSQRSLRKAQVLAAEKLDDVNTARALGMLVVPEGLASLDPAVRGTEWHNRTSTFSNWVYLPDICTDDVKSLAPVGPAIIELRGNIRAVHQIASEWMRRVNGLAHTQADDAAARELIGEAQKAVALYIRDLTVLQQMLKRVVLFTHEAQLDTLRAEIDALRR